MNTDRTKRIGFCVIRVDSCSFVAPSDAQGQNQNDGKGRGRSAVKRSEGARDGKESIRNALGFVLFVLIRVHSWLLPISLPHSCLDPYHHFDFGPGRRRQYRRFFGHSTASSRPPSLPNVGPPFRVV